MKYVLILLIGLCYLNGYAEEFPTASIVELSVSADKIVEAKFITKKDNDYVFITRNIDSKEAFKDTLTINNIDRLFNKPITNYLGEAVGFENSDKLIIYLSNGDKNSKNPLFLGYRLLKDGQIYIPYQPINPGKFDFISIRDSLGWNEFKERIIKVHTRVSEVKNLKSIEDPKRKNKELFSWIEKHKDTFGKNCNLNEDCGWGNIEWKVFIWITTSRIAEDTWKASQLYREINAMSEIDWRKSYGILSDNNKTSFTSYKEIDFLVSITTDKSQPIVERKQALLFLIKASRKVYENNYPIPDSITLSFQVEKQKEIRNAIFLLIDNDELKSNAFTIVKKMSNPMDGNLKHRIDLELLPSIINVYKTEKPSRFRSELAAFIAYNSTAEKWKELTNSDANIFMDLYQLRVDSVKNTLSFVIYNNNGRKSIFEAPSIIIESLGDDDSLETIAYPKFKLLFRYSSGVRYLTIDIEALKIGKYNVYVIGKAGEEGQFNWQSEYGEFEIE